MFFKRIYILLLILLVYSVLHFYWIYRQNGTTYQQSTQYFINEETKQLWVLDRVREMTNCFDRPMVPRTQERGDYWVLYNYVRAERSHACHETITYTTHGDYSFLDNFVPLLERWKGPISIALHAPGTDFNKTLESITYLRDCTDSLVKELVTFHIYFPKSHLPTWVPKQNNLFMKLADCSSIPPFKNVSKKKMYKTQQKLLYPVNVGRNIARETAQTHFIFASDIELYPSHNVIPKFLYMIAENKGSHLSKNPKVFPLHPFEISSTSQVPENKTALLNMIRNHSAKPFHIDVCWSCHGVPNAWARQQLTENKNGKLGVFHVAKRRGRFAHWEPFYIGTHSEPYYDERLSWEGMSDKMTQGYAMCALDYRYLILDDVFLVHKPGFIQYTKQRKMNKFVNKTLTQLLPIILDEMKILFGNDEGCII